MPAVAQAALVARIERGSQRPSAVCFQLQRDVDGDGDSRMPPVVHVVSVVDVVHIDIVGAVPGRRPGFRTGINHTEPIAPELEARSHLRPLRRGRHARGTSVRGQNGRGSGLPECGIRGSRRGRARDDAHAANCARAGAARCLAVPARSCSPRARAPGHARGTPDARGLSALRHGILGEPWWSPCCDGDAMPVFVVTVRFLPVGTTLVASRPAILCAG